MDLEYLIEFNDVNVYEPEIDFIINKYHITIILFIIIIISLRNVEIKNFIHDKHYRNQKLKIFFDSSFNLLLFYSYYFFMLFLIFCAYIILNYDVSAFEKHIVFIGLNTYFEAFFRDNYNTDKVPVNIHNFFIYLCLYIIVHFFYTVHYKIFVFNSKASFFINSLLISICVIVLSIITYLLFFENINFILYYIFALCISIYYLIYILKNNSNLLFSKKYFQKNSHHKNNNRLDKYIFLSYAKEDYNKVKKYNDYILSNGFSTWLDEQNLLPGQDWNLEITKALKRSEIALVFLSNNACDKRGYIQKEITLALDKLQEIPESDIFLIPVLLEEIEIPERLSKLHAVKIYKKNGKQKLLKIISLKMKGYKGN